MLGGGLGTRGGLVLCALLIASLAWADQAAAASLTASQVIERYVMARGGREAWSRVQTMAWAGRMETADAGRTGAPFVMELKRPDKTRFEFNAYGQHSVRAFDGTNGWSLRHTPNGPRLQDFSAEERAFALDAFGMEGPLMNCPANGVKATLEGVDQVEGHQAYRLALLLPSGAVRHSWIDALSFLELRYEREVADRRGRSGTVKVAYRDYRSFSGVEIPMVIETGGGEGRAANRMVIDRVILNLPLAERRFVKPAALAVRGNNRPRVPRAWPFPARAAGPSGPSGPG